MDDKESSYLDKIQKEAREKASYEKFLSELKLLEKINAEVPDAVYDLLNKFIKKYD